jgi:hypothetical protein
MLNAAIKSIMLGVIMLGAIMLSVAIMSNILIAIMLCHNEDHRAEYHN